MPWCFQAACSYCFPFCPHQYKTHISLWLQSEDLSRPACCMHAQIMSNRSFCVRTIPKCQRQHAPRLLIKTHTWGWLAGFHGVLQSKQRITVKHQLTHNYISDTEHAVIYSMFFKRNKTLCDVIAPVHVILDDQNASGMEAGFDICMAEMHSLQLYPHKRLCLQLSSGYQAGLPVQKHHGGLWPANLPRSIYL